MIAVIDYGIGNVRSILNALEYIGERAMLTRDLDKLSNASGLILPGVGAFEEGMKRLHSYDLANQITSLVNNGKPLLGICLGFQMMMKSSSEKGASSGLGFFDYSVEHMPVRARLPHIGWASISTPPDFSNQPSLLEGLDRQFFYFVHSYCVIKPKDDVTVGLANYGGCEFVAIIETGNVFGTQFHPEKSGEMGLALLRNFARLC